MITNLKIRLLGALLASILLSRTALADNPPPCDKTDNECLVRSALAWKYKADALTEQNRMLEQENDHLRNAPPAGLKIVVVCGIAAFIFFGGYATARKALQ